ncbi:MAG TPA: MlaD family protein, partial [Candidatus Caenarcaniphilales bacterium]|nr:MlaD family protein [Candidatus Caenarcaniphilales bacterium]
EGNEVRVGGFRVGVVNKVSPAVIENNRAVALLSLQLDKTVEPLPVDTKTLIRARSSLGLKYLELEPGASKQMLRPGDTLPVATATQPTDFDDFLNTFDEDLRRNSQTSLQGYGDALAGRGQSLNLAIQSLPEFFRHLQPVMDTLNDRDTQFANFFRQLGRAAEQAAPVAKEQAQLFVDMADTFEAFSRNPEALRQTIERQPGTFDASVRSFRVQRPFLAEFSELSRELRPAAAAFRTELPDINTALVEGQETLPRTVSLNENTERFFRGLDDMVSNPVTLLALKDLTTTTTIAEPFVRFVAPYQTVCNYANTFIGPLGDHQSEAVQGGTVERVLPKSATTEQDDSLGTTTADRPADVPKDQDPDTAEDSQGRPLTKLNGSARNPAIDASGNADCQVGQFGYPDGPLVTNPRYKPANFETSARRERFSGREEPSGGSHVILDRDTPGLAGPTFTGVPHLRDVDEDLRSGR